MSESFHLELEKRILSYLSRRTEVDVQIDELKAERKTLNDTIQDLNKVYLEETGESFRGIVEARSAADMAEELLNEFGELHVDKMLELISERQMLGAGQTLKKQSLVATLVKHTQQNKRFQRVPNRTNTFALIEGVKTKEK
jgi:uncharacterized coiled-coil DUF342 family protein